MKHALIFRGGWDGHEPVQTSELVAEQLRKHGMEVEISDSQEALLQSGLEQKYNVIVPVWTMGTLLPEAGKALRGAVLNGVGLGGWHGGMCDAFRQDTEWQFITGGQRLQPEAGEHLIQRQHEPDKQNSQRQGQQGEQPEFLPVGPAFISQKTGTETAFPDAQKAHDESLLWLNLMRDDMRDNLSDVPARTARYS